MSAALLTRASPAERAFERLYRRHVHDVYRYVLTVLRNQADAEDATQSTFLSAYRAIARGDEPEKPRNWLLKIAHNECRQRFRASARRPKEVAWDERHASLAPDETVPTADEIRTALAHLSFNQRSALVMRELEGRSYAEIGEILELSVSAVETLLFRARRALREQLEGALTCGDAEAMLSKRLDGRLALAEQRSLRAHLRECPECAALERRHRARRAAVKRLGIVQLPPSLAGFLGGTSTVTGGAVVGSGLAAKAAAVVAAGVVAGGVGQQAVHAVAAREPARTPLPELRQVPRNFPAAYAASGTIAKAVRAEIDRRATTSGAATTARLRRAVGLALGRRRSTGGSANSAAGPAESGSGTSPAPSSPARPSPARPSPIPTLPAPAPAPPAPPAPVQEIVDTATGAVPPVQTPSVSPPALPSLPVQPPRPPQLPTLPPAPPLPPPPPIGP